MDLDENFVRLTPLGGLGQIGKNCILLETNDSMVMIDCGLMFPEDSLLGVDVVIPRFDYVIKNKHKLKGIVLTHGHEDHIGALPWLMPYVDAPIFGSRFTLQLVTNKLTEFNLIDYIEMNVVTDNQRLKIGDFTFNFFPVCHSVIEGFGLGIETPAGRIVHSGDFKIDQEPLDGHFTDMDAFARFSEPGVLLLMSDSTNVERDGYALTEREIMSSLRVFFEEAQGRILVTLFSSHIQRMQEFFDLAKEFGRKVTISGRSLARNIEMAMEEGFLRVDDDTYCPLEDISLYKDSEIVMLLTGSQGEPLSALTRLALGEHKQLKVKKGDLVLMSSRIIPGNTKAITKVINNLYRLGAEVIYEKVRAIHASGHAHREELKAMLKAVSPRFFVPVHGEYRHLFKHAKLAQECGVAPERSIVLENGNPLTFSARGLKFEESIPVQSILVDGKGVGDVGYTVLKERHILGGEGLVIVVMVISEETGDLLIGPRILSRGFIFEQHYDHVLEDAKCLVLDVFEDIPPGASKKLEEKARSTLRRFFRKILDRDPIVIPLIIKV
ncbi:ribonuclease J [Desulfonatronovibrio magnus]|uniref:ribonuclease J n=1 Tax=Desulfonatronovibrio magnus TaxID=698827 RepID=UPI0005EB4070|nr:ribonuclease J [Desulfonatronovibrio magnus]RQD56940.1 MAG: ribonuclease J [Desulfonatronovibrio sp. MSAO_Bac4]